jgi:phosphatidate cytidylyltransferase
MNEMVTRSLSGAVYVALISALLLLPIPMGPVVLGAILGVLALREIIQLFANQQLTIKVIAVAVVAIGVAHFNPHAAWFMAALLLALLQYLRTGRPQPGTGWVMPVLYLAPAFAAYTNLVLFRGAEAGWFIFTVFAFLWTNDTFAYLGGKAWGKHRLWPSVSPKKSWEGLLVGMAMTMVLGSVWHRLSGWDHPTQVGIILAMVVSMAGNLGDLLESRMKRQLGVKDSGNLIPGHGGILDRIDSFLLALPTAYLCWVLLV